MTRRPRRSRAPELALAAAVCAVVAGCGGPAQESDTEGDDMAATSLTFTVATDDGAKPRTATLECPGGDAAACEALEKVERKTFDPVPKDQACTMILGGPETATVKGRLDGSSLDASFSQQNGCEIARWKQIKPVLQALDLL